MFKNRRNIDPVSASNNPPEAPMIEHVTIRQDDITSIDRKQKTIEGLGDSIKDSVKEDQKAKQKFEGLVNVSTKTIFKTKTMFPDIFFPTEVIVDMTKVTLVNRIFFSTKVTHSIFVADITDVLVRTGPFRAALEIVDAGFTQNSILIRNLPIHDAQKARRIIQGLVITKKQDVDLSKLDDVSAFELQNKLEILGSVDE